MAVNKKYNDYSEVLTAGGLYEKMPKAVIAAVAVGLASRLLGGQLIEEEIRSIIIKEWATLNANGIVPQKPIY